MESSAVNSFGDNKKALKIYSHNPIEDFCIINKDNHKGWPGGWLCDYPNSELIFDFYSTLYITRLRMFCANTNASPTRMELYCSDEPDNNWKLVHAFRYCDRYRQPRAIATDSHRHGMDTEHFFFLGANSTHRNEDKNIFNHPIGNPGIVTSSIDSSMQSMSSDCGRYWKLKFYETNGDHYFGINQCVFYGILNPLPPAENVSAVADNARSLILVRWVAASDPRSSRPTRYLIIAYEGCTMNRGGGYVAGEILVNNEEEKEFCWEFISPAKGIPYVFQVIPISDDDTEGIPSLASSPPVLILREDNDPSWVLLPPMTNIAEMMLADGTSAMLSGTTRNETRDNTPAASVHGLPPPVRTNNNDGSAPAENDGNNGWEIVSLNATPVMPPAAGEELNRFRETKNLVIVQSPSSPSDYATNNQNQFKAILEGNLSQVETFPVATSVCIFVSSTFDDTTAERNYLTEFVFPQLSKFCKARNLEFEVVDLRWGVRDEAADNHRTVDLCLSEVQRCLRKSTAASFFYLAGERYGWRALPPIVNAEEFEEIMSHIPEGKEKDCCTQWYRKDLNSCRAVYQLQAMSYMRDEGGPYSRFWDSNGVLGAQSIIQQAIRPILSVCLGLTPEQKDNWCISVTEREVRLGLFQHHENVELSSMCFLRTIDGLAEEVEREQELPWEQKKITKFYTPATEDRELLNALRERVSNHLPVESLRAVNVPFDVETAEEEGKRPLSSGLEKNKDYLRNFAASFMVDIEARISLGLQRRPLLTADELEVLHHCKFAFERTKSFIGRQHVLQATLACFFSTAVSNSNNDPQSHNHPRVLHGRSGSGKTSLMCKIAAVAPVDKNAIVIVRMCGTSGLSSTVKDLMRQLCKQIYCCYHEAGKEDEESSRTVDPITGKENFDELVVAFHRHLAMSSAEKSLVILIDSLDQLSNADNGASQPFSWLPLTLPTYTTLLLSTLPDEHHNILTALQNRLPPPCFVSVEPIASVEEGYDIVMNMLREKGRQLHSETHRAALSNALNGGFEKGGGLTMLHLKLLSDVMINWRCNAPPLTHPDGTPTDHPAAQQMGSTVAELIDQFFQRLEDVHGSKLVTLTVRLLQTSRDGLSREHLLDLISGDDDVLGQQGEKGAVLEFFTPPVRRLPPLVLTRFLNDFGDYLVQRGQNNATLLSLYHRQFHEVACKRYLTPALGPIKQIKMAEKLAHYFSGCLAAQFLDRLISAQPWKFVDTESGNSNVNIAKIVELPHALLAGFKYVEMADLLCNLEYIEAKFSAGANFAYELLSEYHTVLSVKEISNKEKAVRDFFMFVGKWFTVLVTNPVLTLSLAVNSPRSGNEVYSSGLAMLATSTTAAALSSSNNNNNGNDPSYSNSNTILSNTILRWRNVPHHTDACISTKVCQPFLTACQWASGGAKFVVAMKDRCAVYDAVSMRTLTMFEHPSSGTGITSTNTESTDDVLRPWWRGCCFSPDGNKVCSVASGGNNAGYVWDAFTGNLLLTLKSHFNWVLSCAWNVSQARGSAILTTSADCSAILWNGITGEKLGQLTGHSAAVTAGAWRPDGQRVFTVSTDTTLIVWDTLSYHAMHRLNGFDYPLHCVTVSPDGTMVAVGASNRTVHVWDVEQSLSITSTKTQHASEILSLSFSPDSREILSTGADNMGYISQITRTMGPEEQKVHLLSMNMVGEVEGHGGWVMASDWCEGLLLTASEDGCVKIWKRSSVVDGGQTKPPLYSSHNATDSTGMCLSSDANQLFVLYKDFSGASFTFNSQHGDLDQHSFYPSNGFTVGTNNGSDWRIADEETLQCFSCYSSDFFIRKAFSDADNPPGGTTDSNAYVTHLEEPSGFLVVFCKWDPSGTRRRVVLGGHGGDGATASIYDQDVSGTGKFFDLDFHGSRAWSYDGAWSADGCILAVACTNGVYVFDTSDCIQAKLIHKQLCPIGAMRVSVSGNGQRVCTLGSDGKHGYCGTGPDGYVYDVNNGQEVCKLDIDCTGCLEGKLSREGDSLYLLFSHDSTEYHCPSLILFDVRGGSATVGRAVSWFISPWNDNLRWMTLGDSIQSPDASFALSSEEHSANNRIVNHTSSRSSTVICVGDAKGRIFVLAPMTVQPSVR